MIHASKAEAQWALDKAREKAGKAWAAKDKASKSSDPVDFDVASAHYNRSIAELEAAINDMGYWEYGEASD